MVYDKKTYDEYIKKAIEPTDIQIYRSTPFLITNTEFGYVYSKLRLDSPAKEQSFAKLTFEISFEYNDLSIKESFVHHIEFYQHSCDSRYRKHALDYGTILMPEDMDDFLLAIYKNRQDENTILQNYDISIYDSVHKICEIKNVKSLVNNREVDKRKILFLRRKTSEYDLAVVTNGGYFKTVKSIQKTLLISLFLNGMICFVRMIIRFGI